MLDVSEALSASLGTVSTAHPGVIYYVGDGRNAWHGTWVRRYYSSSFHTKFEDARLFAESQRVQGSVFRITELPVVCYGVEDGWMLVSELNEERPLTHFRPPLTIQRARVRAKRCSWWFQHNTLTQQLKDTLPLDSPRAGWTAAETSRRFHEKDICWSTPENRRTVVKLFYQGAEPAVLSRRQELKIWTSSSIGGQYRLQWQTKKGLSGTAVMRVLDAARAQGADHQRAPGTVQRLEATQVP